MYAFFYFFLCTTLKSPKKKSLPLFPICAAAAERFSSMSFSIFLLSVDYLDSCPLFPAKPVLFILFLASPLQNWIENKQSFFHPCCWALTACTWNNKQQDFWACLYSSHAFVDRGTTRRRLYVRSCKADPTMVSRP